MACVTRALEGLPPKSPMRKTRFDAAVGPQSQSTRPSPVITHFGTMPARPDILLPNAKYGPGPGGTMTTSLGPQYCSHRPTTQSATFARNENAPFKQHLAIKHGKARYLAPSLAPSDVHKLPRQNSKTPIANLLLTGGRSGR